MPSSSGDAARRKRPPVNGSARPFPSRDPPSPEKGGTAPMLTDLPSAQAAFTALKSFGEATIALRAARDSILMAFPHQDTIAATAAASAHILAEASHGLMGELGALFSDARDAPDPDVRAFVRHVPDHIHRAPHATVPPRNAGNIECEPG